MASVYLARDQKHGRDVAIKVIKSDLSASLGHERFLREIEIAARLRHPNIVPLYDSGEVSGSLYFVMPYEDGQSLRERIRQSGALPIADALSVLRDVARALAYAHEHGVVHRDIKPDNVMLSGGAAVVTDFGIAKAVSAALTDAGDATLTQAGTVIGTPTYMAPEQATGDAATDHRADIYSFGCLAFELFAGHPPFQAESSHLLIAAHLATTPRSIAELRPDVPATVADLLARCLAKAPADRPQSARELLPILDAAPGVGIGIASPAPAPQLEARRSRRVSTWVVVAIVVALGATGVYLGKRAARAADPITVAVLPFTNIAGDSAIGLVADGLADEVASQLARVPGILIKSRSGARAYRGQLTPNVTEAGVKLKADYLLTTVVRQESGQWIVSPVFERAADAATLWDSTFHVSPNEQATVADSIVGSLAAALRQRFPRAVGFAPVRSPRGRTSNREAFAFYLKGQGLLARRGRSVKEAIESFRQAIREDSLFASAYSGLSMALALSPWFEGVRPQEVHDDIVAAARRALALDSTLSPPHVALGLAHWQAYDWIRAAAEFKTAIRLDPRNVEARVQYGRLLRASGQHAEALAELREARSLDPASALVLSHLTAAFLASGQLDSALVEARRAMAMDSTNLTTLLFAGTAYFRNNLPQEGRTVLGRLGGVGGALGYELARLGDIEGANQILRRIDALGPAPRIAGERARVYLGLGDTANALSALERAFDAGELWASDVRDPAFDGIRGSARYRAILKRIGLTDYLNSLGR